MIHNEINPFINDEYDLTQRILLNHLNSKSSCSVGTVVSINSSPISVNVQPSIKYFDKVDGFLESQVLSNIPLAQIATKSASLKMPINVGDVGLILWFDREVFSFLKSPLNSPIAPDSGVMFNESACVFIPIIQKFSQSNLIKNSGVDIVSSNISLVSELITTMNDVKTTLNDISNLLNSLTSFCSAIITAGGAASTPLTTVYSAALTSAATTLNSSISSISSSISTVTSSITIIKNDLTTFKGDQ
jgi:hypothetical protein